jgi:integrase
LVEGVPGGRQETSNCGDRKRNRILNDDEIRAMWNAADSSGSYGAVLKVLLLTGPRKDKVATIKWAELN